jgi:cysteinyl-tRNA synthetase
MAKQINILIQKESLTTDEAEKILDAFKNIDAALNIFDFSNTKSDQDIQMLIQQREQARKEGNWDLADKIREQLSAHGVSIRDMKLDS